MKGKPKHLLQNPWVLSILGIGVITFSLSGCKSDELATSSSMVTSTTKASDTKSMRMKKKEAKPKMEMITPPAFCSDHLSLMITGSYLYWGFSQDQMQYAENIVEAANGTLTENFKSAGTNWGSGFRIGLGGHLPVDNWDLMINWTRWHNSKTNNTYSHPGAGNTVIPILEPEAPGGESLLADAMTNSASNRWRLDFDMLDFELGRFFKISKKLDLRPHIGMEFARVNQHLGVNYNNVNDTKGGHNTYFSGKNNFLGLGPRLGIDTRFLLGYGLGFFGNVAGSLLWGYTSVNTSATQTPLSSLYSPISYYITNSVHGLRPTAQLAIGFDWDKCFNDSFYLSIGASYEVQELWDQWHLANNYNTERTGNLSSQGLTVKVRMDF